MHLFALQFQIILSLKNTDLAAANLTLKTHY